MNNIEFMLMRESLHLSRHDLAEIWGVNPRSVQRWDRGELDIPQNRKTQLYNYWVQINNAVLRFKSLLEDLEGKHNPADEIVLLAYDAWSYDGDFEHYKMHNALLTRCRELADNMGYTVRIVPFLPKEYDNWLGNREDSQNMRSLWATEYLERGD